MQREAPETRAAIDHSEAPSDFQAEQQKAGSSTAHLHCRENWRSHTKISATEHQSIVPSSHCLESGTGAPKHSVELTVLRLDTGTPNLGPSSQCQESDHFQDCSSWFGLWGCTLPFRFRLRGIFNAKSIKQKCDLPSQRSTSRPTALHWSENQYERLKYNNKALVHFPTSLPSIRLKHEAACLSVTKLLMTALQPGTTAGDLEPTKDRRGSLQTWSAKTAPPLDFSEQPMHI